MAACLTFSALYKKDYHSDPNKLFIQCSSSELPCPESLGYVQGKTLGSGTYAKVKAAWSPFENCLIAIKNLQKRAASKDYLSKFLPREIEVLQLVNHPNILQVYKIIETDERCLFMLEIAENGDLLDYINARGHIPETEARYIFKQMTSAIAYCHSINVAHRDLKCENIMIDKDMQVKIGDFGFAVHTQSPVSTPCGSYSYAAPELFLPDSRGYDGKKADVWSLGVILYAIVCGRLPFGDDSQVKKSATRVLTFNRHISGECKSLLRGILNPSPDQRLTCEMILSHAWTTGTSRCPTSIQHQPKYTLDNCIPLMARPQNTRYPRSEAAPYPQPAISLRPHSTASAGPSRTETPTCVRVEAHATSQTVTHAGNPPQVRVVPQQRQSKPLVAKIGAAGRRLADAMRQVGSGSRGQLQDSRPNSARSKK